MLLPAVQISRARNRVAVRGRDAEHGGVADVAEAFGPVLGRPAWLVRRGYGSFVTMEFGDPAVDIANPRALPVGIEGAPEQATRRTVAVHGQWHLWIYCCQWSLLLDGAELAHCESADKVICRALHVLDGQVLTGVHIEPGDGSTRLVFDLGCVLATRPAPPGTYHDEPAEQWMLYSRPRGQVLTVRGDGHYQLAVADASADEEEWLPLPGAGTHLELLSAVRRLERSDRQPATARRPNPPGGS